MFPTRMGANYLNGVPAGVDSGLENLNLFAGNFRPTDLFQKNFRFTGKHGAANAFEFFCHGVIMANTPVSNNSLVRDLVRVLEIMYN